ncbi:MAG: ABC transporter permease [Deltaproteobacteria bacterium]|nr:ABC transporter permease [Deltaproteobacteria bacterium]
MEDVISAARLWPVWLRLGLQDVRLRFRRSGLGAGWIFLNLAITLLAIGVVYSRLLGRDLGEFLPFLTVGLIVWGYISSSIVEGGNAFIASEGYIKQISLPMYVYVFRFFVSTSLTMLISFLAYPVVALIYGVGFYWGTLWALLGIFLLGTVSFLLTAIFAHLNTRFRDAAHIASLGLQIMFYVTPVIWPPEMLRDRGLPWIIDLNPLYHLLEVIRQPLLYSQPASPLNYQAVGIFIVVLAIIAGTLTRLYRRHLVYFL